MNRGNNGDIRLERKVSRIRSISDFLLRTESNNSDGSLDEHAMDREDSDYFDDDMEEMEMEIEMSNGHTNAADEEVRFIGTGLLSMSSLSLQHRGETAGTMGNNKYSQRNGSPPLTDNWAAQVRHISRQKDEFFCTS